MGLIADVGGHRGIPFAEPKVIRVTNRAAGKRVAGDLMMFDMNNASGSAPNFKGGATDSAWVNVVDADGSIVPTTNTNSGSSWPVCVLKEDIEAGQEGLAYLWGNGIQANVGGAYGRGTPLLMAGAAGNELVDAATGSYKVYGYLHAATTGAGLAFITFDGWFGLGNQ